MKPTQDLKYFWLPQVPNKWFIRVFTIDTCAYLSLTCASNLIFEFGQKVKHETGRSSKFRDFTSFLVERLRDSWVENCAREFVLLIDSLSFSFLFFCFSSRSAAASKTKSEGEWRPCWEHSYSEDWGQQGNSCSQHSASYRGCSTASAAAVLTYSSESLAIKSTVEVGVVLWIQIGKEETTVPVFVLVMSWTEDSFVTSWRIKFKAKMSQNGDFGSPWRTGFWASQIKN